MLSTLYRITTTGVLRLINQAGVRAVAPPDKGNETFNTCWTARSPGRRVLLHAFPQAGKFDHAKLVRYNYEKNAVEDCVYTGDVVLPQIRQLPHSKFHTSINFRLRRAAAVISSSAPPTTPTAHPSMKSGCPSVTTTTFGRDWLADHRI